VLSQKNYPQDHCEYREQDEQYKHRYIKRYATHLQGRDQAPQRLDRRVRNHKQRLRYNHEPAWRVELPREGLDHLNNDAGDEHPRVDPHEQDKNNSELCHNDRAYRINPRGCPIGTPRGLNEPCRFSAGLRHARVRALQCLQT